MNVDKGSTGMKVCLYFFTQLVTNEWNSLPQSVVTVLGLDAFKMGLITGYKS